MLTAIQQDGIGHHEILDEHPRSLPVAAGMVKLQPHVPAGVGLPQPAPQTRLRRQIDPLHARLITQCSRQHRHFLPAGRGSLPRGNSSVDPDRRPQQRVPADRKPIGFPHRLRIDLSLKPQVNPEEQRKLGAVVEPEEALERCEPPREVATGPRRVLCQQLIDFVHA